MTSYQDRLQRHLASYRVNELKLDSAGVYRHAGVDHPKGHILPVEHQWLNILPECREQVRGYLKRHSQIRLHRYFHHLNSSQAFALNLFVPYFEGGPEASQILLKGLGQGGTLARWQLEEVPDAGEESNLDVTWTTSDGIRTVCEVKLSETEFGHAANDTPHQEKLRDIYRPRLAAHLPPDLLEPAFFFANYQVLRNLWHALQTPTGRLLFLLPRANTGLWSSLEAALARLPSTIRERVVVVSIEEAIRRLEAGYDRPDELIRHAHALHFKYLPPDR